MNHCWTAAHLPGFGAIGLVFQRVPPDGAIVDQPVYVLVVARAGDGGVSRLSRETGDVVGVAPSPVGVAQVRGVRNLDGDELTVSSLAGDFHYQVRAGETDQVVLWQELGVRMAAHLNQVGVAEDAHLVGSQSHVEMAAELRDAMVREHELAEVLIEAGKRYVVDGLRSRREPPTALAERDLMSRTR